MTTPAKVFTSYPRNEQDWILYPRDAPMRRDLYGKHYELAVQHPAKMNAYAFHDIMEYVSKPGETIMDVFGGIGTTMMAALHGRKVILVEIEEFYADVARGIYKDWQDDGRSPEQVTVIQMDNRQVLPIPCDHIVTSPPYGSDLFKDKGALNEEVQKQVERYGASPQNIGRLNDFYYVQEMDKLYKKMVDSVRPGGTISITHRDRIRAGKRHLYSKTIMQSLTKHGMQLDTWNKWLAPMSIQGRVNEAMGNEVVADEDIIIMRKPL